MTTPAPGTASGPTSARRHPGPVGWNEARRIAHAAGAAMPLRPGETDLHACDGRILAQDIRALCDLPPFDAAGVDGYAVRGPAPWTVAGTVLAGTEPGPLGAEGIGVRIATGAMIPPDTDALIRTEEARQTPGGRIEGQARSRREWRERGEQAREGDLLVRAGTPITPGVVGTAAAAGHDRLLTYPRPRLAVVLLGSELLTGGIPHAGRIRDALGPQIPAWAGRLGLEVVTVIGPVPDTPHAHRAAIREAMASGVELIATTGGTMHGPVDHLHDTLADLDADYLVETVRSRPGKPMLLARISHRATGAGESGVLLAGLPGNPQPAILALLTLLAPAHAGMTGRPLPALPTVELGSPLPGRGGETRLALAHLDRHGRAHAIEHDSPAAVHGLAAATGFAVIAPGTGGRVGERVRCLHLPITHGEHP